MKVKNKNEKGAVVLIYVILIGLLAFLFMAIAQSRLLLAIRRSQSESDSLIAGYEAESAAYDFLARLVGGYLDENSFPYSLSYEEDGVDIDLTATYEGSTQTISVNAKKDFAVAAVELTREIHSFGEVDNVDIVLALDCTGSMDSRACPNCADTRFDAQEAAALAFVDGLQNSEDADKFRLGIVNFGIDAKWLKIGGTEVRPDEGMEFSVIRQAIRDGYGRRRASSPACQEVMDSTSIGSAYAFADDYFDETRSNDTKQIEIVITDGEPNSRIPHDECGPSEFLSTNTFCPGAPNKEVHYCQNNPYGWTCLQNPNASDNQSLEACTPHAMNFLRCTLATEDTHVPNINSNGIRNPEVDAYAVTIFANPPAEVRDIMETYSTSYYNATEATQLTGILTDILDVIVEQSSVVRIKRKIPEIQP